MEARTIKAAYRILFLIASPKLASRGEKMLSENHVPVAFSLNAIGTAPGTIIDLLGLDTTDKGMILSIMSKENADHWLQVFTGALNLGAPNSGIAFTIPLNGASAQIVSMLNRNEEETAPQQEGKKMNENEYSMLMAVVDKGYSDDVVNAARAAGAGGGTVINSRQLLNDRTANYWGLNLQDDREIVLMLAPNEIKAEIMSAITEKCGIRSDANGVVFSLPVDAVTGVARRDI